MNNKVSQSDPNNPLDSSPSGKANQDVWIPVRERKSAKRSKLKKTFGTILWFFIIAIATLGGTVAGWIGKSEVAKSMIVNLNRKPAEVFNKNEYILLILGCDEDLEPGGKKVRKAKTRADMILLAKFDFDQKTITGVSIPRDTRVQLPGEDSHKLNAYHNLAKPSEADARQQEAVEHLTGIKVDKTVVIDYLVFQDLINTVGGVKVNIKNPMKYSDQAGGLFIDFKPGPAHLNGYDAMCYVRYRRDKGGDFARTERQRELLLSFKNQVIKNWTNLPQIIEQGVQVLGSNLQTSEVAALANFARTVPQTNIVMTRMPTKRGRGSFEEKDDRKAKELFKKYGFIPSTQSNSKEKAAVRS